MKKNTLLSLTIVSFVFTSCLKMAMLYHGVHSPRIEKTSEIIAFAAKKKIPLEGSAMILEDSILFSFVKRMNNHILFDENGLAINFNAGFENQKCSGNILSFIEGLDTISYITRDSSWTLEKESKMWLDFGTKNPYEIQKSITGKLFNYYVVYYWNVFSGNPNHRDAVKDLQEIIAKNSRIKIKMILVNHDLRDDIDLKKIAEKANQTNWIKVHIDETSK